MHIGTELLEAFIKVHQSSSFTKAANELGLTQSALSQKVARLEDLLSATLFVRNQGSIGLSSSGEKLLLFAKEQLEHESFFLGQFEQKNNNLTGIIRIAGFSSVIRSAIIPTLAPILKENKKLHKQILEIEVLRFSMYEEKINTMIAKNILKEELIKGESANLIQHIRVFSDYWLPSAQVYEVNVNMSINKYAKLFLSLFYSLCV